MTRILPLAAAVVLLASSAIVHGLWTGRWGLSTDVQAAAARCDDLPMTIGEWDGRAGQLDPGQIQVGEIVGYCSRQYVNRRTKQHVAILLICGRPGPVSVHTPDVCYAATAGYVAGNPDHYKAGADADFVTARFAKPGPTPDPLRIFWSWSDGGPWSAPENPRLTFGGSGALYKLYVIHDLAGTDVPLDQDPCVEFMGVLLPALHKCLSLAPPTP
jgi:hypothetical protein